MNKAVRGKKMQTQTKQKEYDSEQVKRSIVQSRVRLLLNHPFFGNLATRLLIKDATDWCPTAAVDGKHLYYNKNFLGALDEKELDFVIAHEVMHCVYDHLERRNTKDPQYWNMAGDYVINRDLIKGRAQERRDDGSGKDIPDEAFDGMKGRPGMFDRLEENMQMTPDDVRASEQPSFIKSQTSRRNSSQRKPRHSQEQSRHSKSSRDPREASDDHKNI